MLTDMRAENTDFCKHSYFYFKISVHPTFHLKKKKSNKSNDLEQYTVLGKENNILMCV